MSATTSSLLQHSEYNPTLMPKILLLTIDMLDVGVFPKRKGKILHASHASLLSYFLCFSHDSLHFAMILLTPSATKTIILGSPTNSPRFGAKKEIYYSLLLFTITIHLSLFTGTIHCSNAVSLPPLWYHSFLAGDSVVVFSVSSSVSTRNFGAQLLCLLLTVVGATLVVK